MLRRRKEKNEKKENMDSPKGKRMRKL